MAEKEKQEIESPQETSPRHLKITVAVRRYINLGFMQNGLPVAQDLFIENTADDPARDVVCEFISDEGLIVPAQVTFGEIPPHDAAGRSNLGILLNQRKILEVTGEPVDCFIKVRVSVAGALVDELSCPVTILAADQWLGIRPYAELLATYVQPNADLVCRLQAETAKEIEAATGRSSLEGYQSGKKRALEICAAIYSAIQKIGISYCNPPSSFGQPGQKLRLPAEIEKFKLATCIETSLLMAAVMEKCELHPVLVLISGHCYVGCHLVEEMFEDVVVWNAQALRKRAALDEFVAIESTKVTGDAPFNEAEKIGRGHLDDDDSFICAIDVVRARESGIRALSLGSDFASEYIAEGRRVSAIENGDVRDLQESIDLSTLKQTQTTMSRIDRWRQKLLDFSARNHLLNIPKKSRQVIRLLCSDMSDLEDKIAANQTITIRSIAESMGEKALDDLLNGRMTPDQCKEIVTAELSHRRLCVMMPPREVVRRLSDLLHEARTSLEKSGLNTLFLTIGELQWVEPGTAAVRKAYRAPILMVPVRLERASMAEGVRMYRLDEETTLNTTLIEFLRAQFDLVLPGLDPLPTDESGVDVSLILQIFRQAVKEKEGWEVLDEATVGCFSFGKFVMWKDMTDRIDELKKNPLVNHLIGGGGSFDDGIEVFPAAEIGRQIKPGSIFCPVSYDSSQLTAVLYSQLGKSFVLHGPPGTGKSQTITNIIAHNLACGRRVLFVSEKKAALDVVKERLDRIGLTPFCLELHSNKTEKGKFYEQIKAALDVPETAVPGEWEQVIADFEKCRAELNDYIRELHRSYPNGLTAYSCFSQMIAHGTEARGDLLAFDCLTQTREAFRDARQVVQELQNASRSVSAEALKVIPPLKTETWSPVFERRLKTAVEELMRAAKELIPSSAAVSAAFGLKDDAAVAGLAALSGFVNAVKGKPKVHRRILSGTGENDLELLKNLFELSERRQALAEALASYQLEKADEVDFDGVARRMEQNDKSFILVRVIKNSALVRELAGLVRLGGEKLTLKKLKQDLPQLREYREVGATISKLSGEAPDSLAVPSKEQSGDFDRFLERQSAFVKKLEQMTEFADPSALPADLHQLVSGCEAALESLDDLRDVLRYRNTLARAAALGVGAFAPFILENDDGNLDAVEVFDDAYAAKMLDAILAQSKLLSEFTGSGHEERIAKFRALDARYTELSRKVVYAKLAATLPRRRSGPCPEGSELGTLKRECEKKTRQKAVRQMLAESTMLIPVLKPCFLMSPLSVAQYLPVDAAPFDLIVFDEASQIPVWDAIGVIARGKQLIVVGDPKQMPPTNFFQKGDIEEDDPEETAIADQESILDECLVAGVFSTYLNWHYRSRHESLIAFSNEHYYANKLCTFPAASNSARLGVKFCFVEGGQFVRQGKEPRVNKVEATALVDYVCSEVLKPGYRKRSIGIVTFSLPQQNLIRTMLEERREKDPALEALLPEEGEGAYFVKNLENVQGDESDVILFSVGYAPDENGRFTMNFGPLNLAGGERRLNVAITRAREQVVVFSSVHGSQIDAGEGGRTKAVGASHLKAFLEYAEKNGGAESVSETLPAHDRFSETVAAFLGKNGYQVDRDVGCSEHRVDIAVRHPDNPDAYLMGVECDGQLYAGQRTVQDRDVNRTGVLGGLGWRMCRVWSVDWAFDRKRAEEHLLKLLADARCTPPPSAPEPKCVSASESAPAAVPETAAESSVRRHHEYQMWKSDAVFLHNYFYEPSSQAKIAQMLEAVVEKEGPIYDLVLRKRVARAWGLSRLTENVHHVFDQCMPSFRSTTHGTGNVFWPKDLNPADYRDFRVPAGDAEEKRLLEEIPPEELMNAMCEVLEELGGCHQDELYRETIRLFGFSTLTAKARKYMDVAFGLLRNSGRV